MHDVSESSRLHNENKVWDFDDQVGNVGLAAPIVREKKQLCYRWVFYWKFYLTSKLSVSVVRYCIFFISFSEISCSHSWLVGQKMLWRHWATEAL